MMHVVVDRAEGKLIRAFTHPKNDTEHSGEVEVRLLSADYFGNHIRHVEQRAYFTEKEIGDALEAMVYRKIIRATQQTEGGEADAG